MKEWLSVWFKAARAPFLIVSFLPAVLGGAIARAQGSVDWVVFLCAVIGIVMAHSAGDFIDDYFDYRKGHLGNKVKQFHDSPLIGGKITLNQVLVATVLCLLVALAAGLYVFLKAGAPVIWLTAAGAFIVLFYTSPPLMLNYRGFGESLLFFGFGPMIVAGLYVVLTGRFDWEPVIVSLVPGIFTMNIGVVSNTFDYADDIASGKRTFSVRFGQRAAVGLISGGTVIAYLAIILGVMGQLLPVWTLLAVLTLPLAISTVMQASRYDDPEGYTPAMTRAIALSSIATILLILAYVIAILRP